LGTVSVVMMAWAAWAHCPACAAAIAAGKPAITRSLGSVSMITPVEKGRTCSGARSSCAASAWQQARARARPSWPVPALALPVLISKARMAEPLARCCRQICTGAAQKRFCVKTAPTALPSSSSMTAKSLRAALRTPASVMPQRTPGTANN
jgi:hypothetical protein